MRNNDLAMSNLESIPGGMKYLLQMYETIQAPFDEARQPEFESTEFDNLRMARRLNVRNVPKGELNSEPLPNPWAEKSALSFPLRPPSPPPPFRYSSSAPNSAKSSSSSIDSIMPNLTKGILPIPHSSKIDPRFPPSIIEQIMEKRSMAREKQKSLQKQPSSSSSTSSVVNKSKPSTMSAPSQRTTTTTSTTSEALLRQRYQAQLEKLDSMGFTDTERNARALTLTGGNVEAAIEWLLKQM